MLTYQKNKHRSHSSIGTKWKLGATFRLSALAIIILYKYVLEIALCLLWKVSGTMWVVIILIGTSSFLKYLFKQSVTDWVPYTVPLFLHKSTWQVPLIACTPESVLKFLSANNNFFKCSNYSRINFYFFGSSVIVILLFFQLHVHK